MNKKKLNTLINALCADELTILKSLLEKNIIKFISIRFSLRHFLVSFLDLLV